MKEEWVFRILDVFNLAMLGKQGWRLIERPDSLCAKVLKGRYYHDAEFMSASRKKHASSTWRAVLARREALQQGLIKRIVNGENTDIWRDRWIANHFGGLPITPREGQEVQQVAELLTASGDWNGPLIRELFVPIDARAILRMPRARGDQDFWAWNLQKFQMYTVKSAYKLLYNRRRDGNRL